MFTYLLLFTAIAGIIFFLSSRKKGMEGSSKEDNLRKGAEYMETNARRDGVITTPSGLQYEVLRDGEAGGRTPKASDQVRCHYEGSFIDGKVFDSSYRSRSPIVFPLNGVIPGWTEGLQYMKEGAKFRFVIPYQLGYGPRGYASIPPCSTLVFEVELIEVI